MPRRAKHLAMLSVFAALTGTGNAKSLSQVVAEADKAGFRGQVIAGDHEDVLFRHTTAGETPPARWIWGSVSKQITASLIMREAEQGKLSLDDPIRRWLPSFANVATGEATIRELLMHTSGLASPDGASAGVEIPAFYLRQGAINSARDAESICTGPGAGKRGTFRYNNCDTIVLGAILERVGGRPYAELLQKGVTRPAGMRTTRMARPGERPVGRMTPGLNLATYGASGGIIGSAEDLIRYNQALMAERIVSAASLQQLWKGEPRLGFVALGAWEFKAPLRGCVGAVRLVERRGHVGGVQVRNLMAPDIGRTLVAFVDRPEGKFDFGEIWRGSGMSYELASAAFCSPKS